MTKSELIYKISEHFSDLTYPQVDRSVDCIIDLMTNTLVEGRRIEIRNFGSFSIHHSNAKTARNPKSGEPVYVEAKAIPHFKPGKGLRERVNGGEYAKYRY